VRITVDHGERVEVAGLTGNALAMRSGDNLSLAVLAVDLEASPAITGKTIEVLGERWKVTAWATAGRVITFTCRRIAGGL